jgi:hypothetical protein
VKSAEKRSTRIRVIQAYRCSDEGFGFSRWGSMFLREFFPQRPKAQVIRAAITGIAEAMPYTNRVFFYSGLEF